MDESIEITFLKSEFTKNFELLRKNKDKNIEELIISFLIIRAVTYFEISMQALVKIAINSLKSDLRTLFNDEWKIPITQINVILNEKLTKAHNMNKKGDLGHEIFPIPF